MDAQRLLGMLNGPPAAATQSSPSPAQHSAQVSSPPATLQSLLSQLQSPPLPSPRDAPPHLMSPPMSDGGHAAELFRNAGMLPNIPPQSSHLGGPVGPNHHRVVSPSAGNAQSLLATLMSGSNPGSNVPSPSPGLPFGLKQPVVDHTMMRVPAASEIPLPVSPAPPVVNDAQPASVQLGRVSTNQSNRSTQEKAQKARSPSQAGESEQSTQDFAMEDVGLASPQIEGTGSKETAPTASKFTFISPFDVFDLPAPTQPAVKKEATSTPSHKSPISFKHTTPKVPKQLPKQVAASPKVGKSNAVPPPALPATQATPSASPAPPAQVVQDTPASKNANVPPILYAVTAEPGTRPEVVPIDQLHYTFDLSSTTNNLVGAVDKQYQEEIATVKTTVLTAGMQPGHKISTSKTFISYALAKGKTRVIDYTSGANAAAILDNGSGSAPKVVEIAVSESYLAALGEDGTLGLWWLDSQAGSESLSAVSRWMTGPNHAQKGPIARSIRWIEARDSDEINRLIVTTETAAYMLSPSTMSQAFDEGSRDWANLGQLIGTQVKETNLVDVAVSLQRAECVQLFQDNSLLIGSILDKQYRELNVRAPAQGGSWRSIVDTGSSLVLGSTRDEYAIFPLEQNGEMSASSSLVLRDPSGTQDASTVPSSTAVFDAKHGILWIAVWARASLLAVKVSGTGKQVFSACAEIAIGSVSDLATDLSDVNQDASVVYRHLKGFSMLTLHPSVMKKLDEIEAPLPLPESDIVLDTAAHEEQPIEQREERSQPTQEEIETTPASPVMKDAALGKDVTVNLPKAGTSPVQASTRLQASPDIDYTKIENLFTSAISKSVDAELRQVLGQQNDIRTDIKAAFEQQTVAINSTFRQSVLEAVQGDLNGLLPRIVKEEMASSILPQLQEILREEVEKHVGDKLANAILFSVETTVMSQVEKALVPHLGRTFTSILSPAVDKSVRSLIDEKLLPQFVAAVEHVPLEVSRAIHQEMLDVRKDVMIEQSSQATASDAAMLTMSKSLAALSEQVQSLTREIEALRASQSGAMAPAVMLQGPPGPPTGQMPHMVPQGMYNGAASNNSLPPPPPPQIQQPPQQSQIISPQPVLAPNVGALQQLISGPEDAEDVFLKAFSSLSEGDLVQFVTSRMPRTAEYLPDPRERPSPLSQAVLLTMVHRLSKCLDAQSTESREYQAVMTWIYRASLLINPRDETIQSYLPAVRQTLEDTFRAAMDHFTRSRDNSSASRSAGQMMLKIISILNRPQA